MSPITANHPSSASDHAGRSSVKTTLTPNQRRRPVENDEYGSFTRRVIRAHARRIAAGDVDALADMTGLATELDEAISQAVTGLRWTGYSWAEIAARLDITRQAAQQRSGRPLCPPERAHARSVSWPWARCVPDWTVNPGNPRSLTIRRARRLTCVVARRAP